MLDVGSHEDTLKHVINEFKEELRGEMHRDS